MVDEALGAHVGELVRPRPPVVGGCGESTVGSRLELFNARKLVVGVGRKLEEEVDLKVVEPLHAIVQLGSQGGLLHSTSRDGGNKLILQASFHLGMMNQFTGPHLGKLINPFPLVVGVHSHVGVHFGR